MAKKFFNKRVNSKKRNIINAIIIIVAIIGIIICFMITKNLSKTSDSPSQEVIVTLQEEISRDINSGAPDTDVYFLELSGISESDIIVNYDNVDFSTLGSYEVYVTVLDEEYVVLLNVVDVSSPELIVESVTIEEGSTYSYNDFVTSCSDNSGEECILSFSTGGVDEEGDSVDYSSFTSSGTYTIVILAKDASGNETYKTTNLIIGENSTNSNVCSYGSDSYTNSYILSYSVSNNGCAISLNLYQSSSIREPMETIADNESEKIKTDIDSISGLTSNIIINRSITAILNESGDGFVGYSLYMEVTTDDGDIIVSYYLNEDGSRVYILNPYSLS